jgi:hypothetical protein
MSDHTLEDIEALINGEVEEKPDEENPEVEVEGNEDEESEEEVDEEEAPPAEEDDEEDPEAEAPEEEDDWQLKARKIQAAKDREVAQLQKELQELREAQAEARGREKAREEYGQQEQTSQLASVTPDDLQHGVETNLPGTFQWTVMNRPDLVPSLITMVRETEGLGHGVADQMVVEYQGFLHQQALNEAQSLREELKSEREAEQAPLRSQQAMHDVVENLTERFGETFEAAKPEIEKRLQTDGREYIQYLADEAAKAGEEFRVTPDLMRDMMVDIYLEIRENALNEQAMQPAKPSKVPAGAKALGQSASNDRPDDDEDFLDSFIQGAREADLSIDASFLP